MPCMKSIVFLVLTFLFHLPASAQTQTIVRLKSSMAVAPTPAARLEATLNFCSQGYNLHPDTLMTYAYRAERLARHLEIETKVLEAMYYRSYAYTNKGLIDSSLALANVCESELRKLNQPALLCNVLNQKGRCYMRKNKYKEAIFMGYEGIIQAEKAGDILLQMKAKTLIGWAYLEMGQLQQALRWHNLARHTAPNEKYLQQYGILFANLALNYNALGKTDSAFYSIDKAIRYSRVNEDLFALSNALAIQGQLFIFSGQQAKAEKPLQQAVAIRNLIGDPFYIVSDMAQLALYYANTNQPEKGIAISQEGLGLAKKYNIETKLIFLNQALAANYKAARNLDAYSETMESLFKLRDSIYAVNTAQSLAEMQANFETQRKENTIARQKLQLVTKNYQLYGTLALLALAIIAAITVISQYRKKQHLKLALIQNEEKRNAEKAVSKAEEAERKRIAADLHDSLGAYAASMASNIDQLYQEEPEHAVALQELQNNAQAIVSQLSDTIWVLKKDAVSVTAISDRLKLFFQKISPSYPGITIDVFENITTDHLLQPSQGFQLFQIIKEAVNNALRHSNGTHISVDIKSWDKNWKLVVTDNGCGFAPPSESENAGDGLKNMRNRATESGCTICWKQNDPHGTSVIIEPTTN